MNAARPGITCKMQPSAALVKQLGRLGVVDPKATANVCAALDDLVSVDALAGLLDEGIGKTLAADGRLDLKDLAAFVLRRMKENQK